jgi:hypothetical protein
VQRFAPQDRRVAAAGRLRQLPLRGGAFVIAAEDRGRFDDFWLRRGDFTGYAGDSRYDFEAVEIYEVQAGARVVYRDFRSGRTVEGGPVAITVDYPPPRLARLAPADVSEPWLSRAKLDDPADYPGCLTGVFSPPAAVYCGVTESDVEAGYLVQGEFTWAWVQGSACDVAKIIEFVTAVPGVRAGGHVLFVETVSGAMQGCNSAELLGKSATKHYAGDPANGVVSRVASDDAFALLDSIIGLPAATVAQVLTENTIEVSRSAPVVAAVGGERTHIQGSYELLDPEPRVTTFEGVASAASFEFPHVTGHLRGHDAARIGDLDTAFVDLPAQFDVATSIAAPNASGCDEYFRDSCRSVFTHTESSGPNPVMLATTEARVLRPLMGASLSVRETATLISRVLAGHQEDGVYVPRLGGVDRSTMAVVQQSPLIRNPRPTVIYVGALDGMLHAICAEELGPCTNKGQELWAFVPRNQLPLLRRNAQRLDGSPAVADVFAEFGGEKRKWRTVLTFQTGGQTPGVYALDVTDPGDPKVLWEVTDVGVGLGLAMGPVEDGNTIRNFTFALTNDRDRARSGFSLVAIDSATGEIAWRFEQEHPAPRDRANPPVPATGIPGGATTVDATRSGFITHVVVPTLYGDVWLVDARTGANHYEGGAPLFRFDSDFHPIGAPAAVYRKRDGGALHAVIGSGGFVDPVRTSWAPDGVDQFVVSIPIPSPSDSVPVAVDGAAFATSLAAGARVYAQPTVAGNELFATADVADPNLDTYGLTGATGSLLRFHLSEGRQRGDRVVLAGGASSVDATSAGVVHTGAGTAARRVDFGDSFDPVGETTELVFTPGTGRQVWLRLR